MTRNHTFAATWSSKRHWWNLHCRICGTIEELPRGNLPEDKAQAHARWWHLTRYEL